MFQSIRGWFRRNAFGQFMLRLLVAIGSAIVTIALSFLPYETLLQAVWVVASSMFMGYLALHQRLNESDESRYERLFTSRFAFLRANDPEALNTLFADNLRPRVFEWFSDEFSVNVGDIETIDALDSLSRNGDAPGRLIFRAGIHFGQWLVEAPYKHDVQPHFEHKIKEFIASQVDLLGDEVADGVFLRHVRIGEQVPTGIHMFHPKSRLLLSIKYYEGSPKKYSISLSARTHCFREDDGAWDKFKEAVLELFEDFRPMRGGSGPQRLSVPFFVSSVMDQPVPNEDGLVEKLQQLEKMIPRSTETEDSKTT